MAKNERIALKADPGDPEDFDVSEEGLAQAQAERRARRGRPLGSVSSQKQQIALRVDRDVLARFRQDGPGWQSRMNDALRKAAGLLPGG
jgi:uncharacterized protein (DUF4415 family)